MWPRAEAHGNASARPKRDRFESFNVAAGRSPRKLYVHTYPYDVVLYASMWPRAEAHGNFDDVEEALDYYALQCGRGPKPTEIDAAILEATCLSTLQCGRGPKPTEMYVHTYPYVVCAYASMWPRAEAHGNPNPCAAPVRPPSASMWPRAEAHGNYIGSLKKRSTQELQCGRGPKPTEMGAR